LRKCNDWQHNEEIVLKIAVNTRFLLPRRLEGFGWYTHEILRRMVVNHPDDTFIFLFDRPFDPAFVYASNVVPVVVPPPARHPLLFYAWFEWQLPRMLRKYQADVFFSPDSMCSLSTTLPTLMTVHDIVPLHLPRQFPPVTRNYLTAHLPRMIHRADHIVTVSEYVRNDIIDTCKMDPQQVSVVYNGCRERFLPLNQAAQSKVQAKWAGGKPYFLYTGAIHPRKNIPRMIAAFDAFKAQSGSNFRLLLAGRFAWQSGPVKTAWDAARHQADIRFLDYVDDADLHALVGGAHALLYLSLSEGFGLPMVEAMQAGVPVVAADATCLPEVAGGAALLVDPLDTEAIRQGLETIATDPRLRSQLSEMGLKRAKMFSWEQASDEIYRKLADLSAKK
jgi:glycosyltransferase involved in cell wall biosynthesis